MKCEYQQPSGAHKDRETQWIQKNYPYYKDYCITTSGNAGISLAYAFKNKAQIFCPHGTSIEKRLQMLKYGATVFIGGDTYSDAFKLCEKYVDTHHAALNVSTGLIPKWKAYKTLAKELEQFDFKNIFVPAGTFTLAGGLAKYFKGTVYACILSTCANIKEKQMFGSICVNFRDKKLIELLANLITLNVPAKILESLLEFRRNDPLLKQLDPCVILPFYMAYFTRLENSVVIATGVDRK